MRAASLEEADYALAVVRVMEGSGYQYTFPTTSYHQDCAVYALNLAAGEAVRFRRHVNAAKRSGWSNELDGDKYPTEELRQILRSRI